MRVQHAMEISLSKRCLKELVVAVEWSENDSLLTEILKWAETNQKEITVIQIFISFTLTFFLVPHLQLLLLCDYPCVAGENGKSVH